MPLAKQRREKNDRDALVNRIVEMARNIDLANRPEWAQLDVLSSRTIFEGAEVDPEGVIVNPDGTFSGVMTVYVLLQYDPDADTAFSDSDSLLAEFKGHVGPQDKITIDYLELETSPFLDEGPSL